MAYCNICNEIVDYLIVPEHETMHCSHGQHCVVQEPSCAIDMSNDDHSSKCCTCKEVMNQFAHLPLKPIFFEFGNGDTGKCDENQEVTGFLRTVFLQEPGTTVSITYPAGYTVKYWMMK